MTNELTPKSLAERVGISGSYASQILNGRRPCPQDVALAAFRAFGVRLGLLAEMTEADLDRLCAERGGDGAVCSHAPASAPDGDGASAFKDGADVTCAGAGVRAREAV